MLPKIVFCTAVSVATVAVILLALVSPVAHWRSQKNQTKPWLLLSLYIQRPHQPTPSIHVSSVAAEGALIFHHILTEGPRNSSQVVGRAQGFVIPIENFAHSSLNIIYLTLETPAFCGSLSIQAKNIRNKLREELTIVGGTGSFAFARGLAILTQADAQAPDVDAMYHVKLRLRFREHPRPIPG
ncbi:dirigent protein 11-like [Aristolochia californica]|uniref:dirigent protein 11-like n=1 Tax=Aristolochia californica TaxID=171875 RepID=UPI0035DBF1B7